MRSLPTDVKPWSRGHRPPWIAAAFAAFATAMLVPTTPVLASTQIITFTSEVQDGNKADHLEGTAGAAFFVGTFDDSSICPCVTDPGPSYTVNISWGDNTTGPGAATLTGQTGTTGHFSVSATHAFTDEFFSPSGNPPIGFTVRMHVTSPTQPLTVYIDPNPGAVAARDGALNSTVSTYPFSATASKSFTGQIAQFSDTNLLAAAKDMAGTLPEYGLSIDWGDGVTNDTSTGSVVVESPCSTTCTVDVFGTHTYNLGGTYPVTVTVGDGSNTKKLPASATATVSQFVTGTVNSDGNPADNLEGIGNPAIDIGSFTDSDACPSGCQPATDYKATTIDWGDGSVSLATSISFRSSSGTTGTYDVEGAHTYAQAGTYPIKLTVTDSADGLSNVASGTLAVGEAPLDHLAGGFNGVVPQAGVHFSGQIATIHDDNQLLTASDGGNPEYALSINWGDGSGIDTTSGAFAIGTCGGSGGSGAGQGCPVTITGGHTYTNPGSYTVTISISDGGTVVISSLQFTAVVPTGRTANHQEGGVPAPGKRATNQSSSGPPGTRLPAGSMAAAPLGRAHVASAVTVSATATSHSRLMDAKIWLFSF